MQSELQQPVCGSVRCASPHNCGHMCLAKLRPHMASMSKRQPHISFRGRLISYCCRELVQSAHASTRAQSMQQQVCLPCAHADPLIAAAETRARAALPLQQYPCAARTQHTSMRDRTVPCSHPSAPQPQLREAESWLPLPRGAPLVHLDAACDAQRRVDPSARPSVNICHTQLL